MLGFNVKPLVRLLTDLGGSEEGLERGSSLLGSLRPPQIAVLWGVIVKGSAHHIAGAQ